MIARRTTLRSSQARTLARGFTLVELMAVVAIVAILAGLGVYGVRKYILAAKTSEATEMIGAIKTAHISEYLATPTAEFVGITASDILNYELPTDALTPRDIGALNAEKTDPRFATDFWKTEIDTMLRINKKAEQQGLAKYGLDYVTDTYLPEKLGEIGLM